MENNIEVFIQSSIRIAGSEGVIYMDPLEIRTASHDADYIFVTHDHYDHFSPSDIAKVAGTHTILIVPEKMAQKAAEVSDYVSQIITVSPDEKRDVRGLAMETVASYNVGKAFHPKDAKWVGYVVTVDGRRIYVAGDTDATKEAKAVSCDVALVPIGGTYTMTAVEAAELVNTIQPDVAIPTHYGSIVGKKEDAKTFTQHVNPPTRVEIKIP